jgi:uncharacterized protein YcfJ
MKVAAVVAFAFSAHATAQVSFFENEGYGGRHFTTQEPVANFAQHGFNDRASSVVVARNQWEVCDDAQYRGRCVILRPGSYPSLSAIGLNDRISSVRSVSASALTDQTRYAAVPEARVTFYENRRFDGRSFTTSTQVADFQRFGFNDRASSVEVHGERWEVCEDARFRGRCVVLRPGAYPSLASMGLNDRVSSVREVDRHAYIDDNRYAPSAVSPPDYRRRNNERIYEANVTSVRAVLATPEQRCWIEREEVTSERSGVNIPGTVIGAIIGGILGHQVGGGSGQDIATVGGVIAGGAVGANVGRGSNEQPRAQDIQRCENLPSQARPEFWDVTYNFRGVEHRVQRTNPPGSTVSVNERGEPRT